ncbi:hypothetical protein SELMODRAFT_412779 [Selaginella moellendorffii]|uniref:Replication factor A C-terminal domain-containing protein n=1 Tax=Selaginella moellendorffii TaxID=88036 RepID=D8RM91_SELML|nr:hypothetical protein SELMODRAFT_412779 [Selaginella moellendorffii]
MEIKCVEDDLCIPNVVLNRTSVLDASKLGQETFIYVIVGVMWIGQTNISPKDSGAFMRRRMICLSDDSIDMCLWDSNEVKEFQTGDFYYPACVKVVNGRQCGKKVTQASESMWQCNSCDTDSGDALHLCILDSTAHIWAVAFDDAANEIIGMPELSGF